jgi:hypothetical protein
MFRGLANFIRSDRALGGRARLTALATKVASEGARVAVNATLTATVSPLAGQFLGTVAKDVVETLLARTTAVEQKLDILLREPLFSGLQLLREASQHVISSKDQLASRDELLDGAHLSFVRAHSLVADSRQDSVFVRSLDCLALASRTGRLSIGLEALSGVHRDMEELRTRVQALEADANEWLTDVHRIRAFLGRDDWGAKPFGYDALLGWSTRHAKNAEKKRRTAEQAREELDRLNNFVELAELAIKGAA